MWFNITSIPYNDFNYIQRKGANEWMELFVSIQTAAFSFFRPMNMMADASDLQSK